MESEAGGKDEIVRVPESFEQAFGVEESFQNVQRGMGEVAMSSTMNSEGIQSIEAELAELGRNGMANESARNGGFSEGSSRNVPDSSARKEDTIRFSGVDMETGMKESPEARPLSMDGSTEGKMGRAAIAMTGGDINMEVVKEIEKSKEELKDDFRALSSKRDEMMVKVLKDDFSLIFGDDGNENDGVDQGGLTGYEMQEEPAMPKEPLVQEMGGSKVA